MLHRQIHATGLSELVTLLKSTFKLPAISAIYYLLAMEGKMFDTRLIPKFSGAAPLSSRLKMWNLCVSFAL